MESNAAGLLDLLQLQIKDYIVLCFRVENVKWRRKKKKSKGKVSKNYM